MAIIFTFITDPDVVTSGAEPVWGAYYRYSGQSQCYQPLSITSH